MDLMNHQELWTLLPKQDFVNAPPLSALPPAKAEAFSKIIQDIDAGRLTDVEEFAARIKKEVYNVTFAQNLTTQFDRPDKYQAVNFNRLAKGFKLKQKTIELRALPVQSNIDEFLLWVGLFQGRLDHMKNSKLISLEKFDIGNSTGWMKNFEAYVKESGLSVKDFRPFLLKNVPKDGCAKLLKTPRNESK